MAQYHSLSKELQERILEDREKHKKNPYAFPDEKIVRRRMDHDKAICGVRHLCGMWRKLCMCRITTVIRIRRRYFPFTRMMTSRRALHVQLVSRIARISAVCWDSMKV